MGSHAHMGDAPELPPQRYLLRVALPYFTPCRPLQIAGVEEKKRESIMVGFNKTKTDLQVGLGLLEMDLEASEVAGGLQQDQDRAAGGWECVFSGFCQGLWRVGSLWLSVRGGRSSALLS